MYAIDKIKDAEDAAEYCDRASAGIVRTLTECHKTLKEVHARTDDSVTQLLVESVMLKLEAQLNY